MSQHTPTPWWIDDDGFIASGTGDSYLTVADPHCMEPKGHESEIVANAEIIVRAVNCHADLLAALRAIVARVNGVWDDPALVAFGPLLPDTACDCEEIARAALAKAENGVQSYAERVRAYEDEGMTTSDAQACVDAEGP